MQLLTLELGTSPNFVALREPDEGDEEAVKKVLHSLFGKKQRGVNNVINDEHLTQVEEQVADIFSLIGTMSWTSFVQNRLPILELPEDVLEAVRSGELAYTKGRLIAKLEDEGQRVRLLKEALDEGLSGTQLRQRLRGSQDKTRGEASFSGRAAVVAKALRKRKKVEDKKVERRIEKLLSELEKLLTLK